MQAYVAECKGIFQNESLIKLLGSGIVRDQLGARIRRARIKAGLTQQQLANKMGLQRPTITQWESGKTTIRADRLEELARALGLPRLSFSEGCQRPMSGKVLAWPAMSLKYHG